MKCRIPLDFAIIVDTSGSVSRRNFQLLLRFIRDIVFGFEISEDFTHIALIEYSTQASVQLKFNDLTGRNINRYSVNRRVNRIPHRKGYTYIDRALRLANEQVFTYEAGMRDYVKKVKLIDLNVGKTYSAASRTVTTWTTFGDNIFTSFGQLSDSFLFNLANQNASTMGGAVDVQALCWFSNKF